MRVAGNELGNEANGFSPNYILTSWTRCEEEFGLTPDRVAWPDVLTKQELLHISDRLHDLNYEAEAELKNLFLRLSPYDYLVTLADRDGVTLQNFVPTSLEDDARTFALYNGSIWGEAQQGTNGVGTAIQLGEAVSVVEGDHFSEKLTRMTCTAAPIFDSQRRLSAVLNVTTPRSTTRREQAMTLQIVKQAAKRIENLWFSNRFGKYAILQVADNRGFSDLANCELLAIDDTGFLVASTLLANSPLSPRNHNKQARKNYLLDVLGLTPGRVEDAIAARQPVMVKGAKKKEYYLQARNGSAFARREKDGRRAVANAKTAEGDLSTSQTLSLSDLAAGNAQLTRSLKVAKRAFEGGLPILLTGETGTGKGAFAKALHLQSTRADKPFVPINCAAIPDELFESILFGYRPGAFTGAAKEGSQGSILEANGGTLFLDEIGDMPLNSQVRLLRVLSEKEVTPLGSSLPIAVDIKVISATLHDLNEKIGERKFRRDLFYRIAAASIEIPALRHRADKCAFITALCAKMCDAQGKSSAVSPAVRRLLEVHPWQGNIRELISVLDYALVLDDDGEIGLDDLPDYLGHAAPS